MKRHAEAGATYDRIVLGLEIPPEALQEPAVQERLRQLVDRGNAKYDLQLGRALKRRGIKEGSVNVLLGAARNRLDWDQQLAQQQGVPDLEGVGARLTDLLDKLARRPADPAA